MTGSVLDLAAETGMTASAEVDQVDHEAATGNDALDRVARSVGVGLVAPSGVAVADRGVRAGGAQRSEDGLAALVTSDEMIVLIDAGMMIRRGWRRISIRRRGGRWNKSGRSGRCMCGRFRET